MAKILIAEDDPVTSRIIASVIEGMGHMSVRCSNGRRALETLVDNPDFARLVTDIEMPEMSGETLIAVLQGEDGYRRTPVVVVSGVVDSGSVVNLMQQGAAMCIKKPIVPKRLKAVIEKYIDPAQGSERKAG